LAPSPKRLREAERFVTTAVHTEALSGALTFEQVRQILSHRFPFQMVDKVLSLEPGARIVAIKHVSGNDIFFLGHFPDRALMPGVLVIEAMAQALSLLDTMSRKPGTPLVAQYLGRVEAQFLKPIMPGDSMEIEGVLLKQIPYAVIAKATVRVDGQVAARAEITMGNGRKAEEARNE
jgi:3-hydroxyacyl-[acyl-carrier-protein] dehydratase